jgi:hypothetical protein
MQAAAVKPFLLTTDETKRVNHTQVIVAATHAKKINKLDVGWDGGMKKYNDSKLNSSY